MKQILVLAYYFPPLGGAGVQRTVAFVQHLRARGYASVVVTGPESGGPVWAPPDETLARQVPAETAVLRVTEPVPGPGTAWQRRRERWLARPSRFARWWVEGAVAVGREALGHVDLVYAAMSPFETAAAARRLAGEAGVPWVADLRDPWALDEWTVYPSGLHRRLELRRMRAVLATATAVVMNTPEAARALAAAAPELDGRIEAIPNGWERSDFEEVPSRGPDGAFRIVYAGYSHVAAGERHRRLQAVRRLLGGAAPGLDVLARSQAPVEAALARLFAREPALASRVELHVAGSAPASASPPWVRYHGYLPHHEAVALMRSADLLFLPMHGLPEGVRARGVPGKTYEYLAARRPILAALPDGDARDLLAGLPNVRLCRPGAVECLADGVRDAVAGSLAEAAPDEVVARFERRELAARLADVLDRAVEAQGRHA